VDDRSENKEKPKNEANPQPNNESASQSEAQKLKGEDADLVHEHLEPGLNIEAQKEIEKEDRTDPQNKEAEDHINNKKDGKNDDLADKSILDYYPNHFIIGANMYCVLTQFVFVIIE